jgi:predicted nucleic-acid-binding protein
MKALDTNVLVRFLVKDDERQSKIVYRAFKQAETDNNTFFVPLLVVLETLWVLESVYNIARNDILDSIDDVLLMPILKFEAQATIQHFILLARENKIDLSDILIACSAKLSGCNSVLTFDKKASKFDYFEIIGSNFS